MDHLLFFLALLPVWQDSAPAPYWLALSVADADASAVWYSERLGFEIFDKMDLPERGIHIRFLKLNGFHLELAQRGDSFAVGEKVPGEYRKSQVRGYYKFGLLVTDLDSLVTTLRAAGVSFQGDIVEDKRFGTRFAMVRDPDGNLIQLFERLPER